MPKYHSVPSTYKFGYQQVIKIQGENTGNQGAMNGMRWRFAYDQMAHFVFIDFVHRIYDNPNRSLRNKKLREFLLRRRLTTID